tara:strand:+ start:1324 stop:1593 length:270 start_codon:yes stop_codon:yes gene_type:complete
VNLDALIAHRTHCFLHVLKRARARHIDLSPAAIESLQDAIERLERAFVRDGQARYRLTVRHAGQWLVVTYDARLHCLVTVWTHPNRRHL